MGDAFTAVNDDEYALFYNPASLGRDGRDLTLTPFNPSAEGTNILSNTNKFKNFPTTVIGASDLLMDFPVHASAGITPGFKLFNLGVSFIANDSYDVLLRNRTHPTLDLDLRSDRGVVLGFGIPITPSRLTRKSKSGSQTTLGLSGKYIERTGLVDSMALTGPTVLDALNKKDAAKIIDSLGRVKGIGWGVDLGLEHVSKFGPNKMVVGLSAMDIGGTNFKEAYSPNGLEVSNVPGQVNAGLAFGQDLLVFDYILSADIRGLNQEMDFGKRIRLGAQIGIPGLKLMAGMNSGYYSYGATVDLFFLKVTAGLYDVEIGSKYQQTQSKRLIIYLSLFDFSFDA